MSEAPTPAQAERLDELAAVLYQGHPAARALLELATHATGDEQLRAAAALTCLDLDNPVHEVRRRAQQRSERGALRLVGADPDAPDAEREPVAGTAQRGELLSLRELAAFPLPVWRIYQLFTGLTLLWAGPGSFKTFLAIAWAVAIASGRPWCGRTVKQGAVIYVCGEGALRAFYNRVTAAAGALGLSPAEAEQLPIYATTGPVNLGRWDGVQAQEFRTSARRVVDRVGPIGAVIPDTFSRCVPGEENAQETMQGFVATCDELRREFGCDVLPVHHANADGVRERGSSVLGGAVDGNLQLVPGVPDAEGSVPLSLYALKLKEADAGPGRDPVARLLAVRTVLVGPSGEPLRDEMGLVRTTRVIREATVADVTAEESSDQALLDAIQTDGTSASKLCSVLGRGKGSVLRDLARLAGRGTVRQTGSGKASRWVRC